MTDFRDIKFDTNQLMVSGVIVKFSDSKLQIEKKGKKEIPFIVIMVSSYYRNQGYATQATYVRRYKVVGAAATNIARNGFNGAKVLLSCVVEPVVLAPKEYVDKETGEIKLTKGKELESFTCDTIQIVGDNRRLDVEADNAITQFSGKERRNLDAIAESNMLAIVNKVGYEIDEELGF